MFYAKHYSEIPANDVTVEGAAGVKIRWLIDKTRGPVSFSMREFDIAPEGHTPYHAHDWEHEVIVLGGEGYVRIDEIDYPLTEGSVVYVPAGAKHQFRNVRPFDQLRMICVIPSHGK